MKAKGYKEKWSNHVRRKECRRLPEEIQMEGRKDLGQLRKTEMPEQVTA